MKELIKKEILHDLEQAALILEQPKEKEAENLKTLSDHAIEDVAAHKDIDLVAVTVLLYSFYKVVASISPKERQSLVEELRAAQQRLGQGSLGKYNTHIKNLFDQVRKSNAKVKEHLQDVLHAARIKKGTILLEKGLSMGQAAGLMGLSNWDLQAYAGKTTALDQHKEAIPAKKRLQTALAIFGVRS